MLQWYHLHVLIAYCGRIVNIHAMIVKLNAFAPNFQGICMQILYTCIFLMQKESDKTTIKREKSMIYREQYLINPFCLE